MISLGIVLGSMFGVLLCAAIVAALSLFAPIGNYDDERDETQSLFFPRPAEKGRKRESDIFFDLSA